MELSDAVVLLCFSMSVGEKLWAFGYRTSMSKKNQQTWDFANMYFARLWIKVGLIMLPLSVVLMFPVLGKSTETVGWWGGALSMVQCIILIVSIFPVERALNKNFDKDGNPKSTNEIL